MAHAYIQAVMTLPAFITWREAARGEPWVLPHDEVDWPQVFKE
jgi:glutathione S-transferase